GARGGGRRSCPAPGSWYRRRSARSSPRSWARSSCARPGSTCGRRSRVRITAFERRLCLRTRGWEVRKGGAAPLRGIRAVEDLDDVEHAHRRASLVEPLLDLEDAARIG